MTTPQTQSQNRLSEPPRKVVVVQTAYVGDVVFASPLVHAVKEAYPAASVSMLVQPDKAELAGCIPGVDEVVTVDKRRTESGPLGVFKAARRLRQNGYDLLISPHRSSRSAILAGLSGIPLRIGYRQGLGRFFYHLAKKPEADQPCNLIQDLEMLGLAGIDSAGTQLRLKSPEGKQGYLDTFYRGQGLSTEAKLVGLCIGSVWPTKRWSAVYFASLAGSLLAQGLVPVLFGGPDDLTIARQIETSLDKPLVSCVGNRLSEAAALLAQCVSVVGGDSGLTHMARALGTHAVIIYGPTDPRMHCFLDSTRVLTAKVACRPCSRHGQHRCPHLHHDCMRLISPEQVLGAIAESKALQTPAPRGDLEPPPRPRSEPPDSSGS